MTSDTARRVVLFKGIRSETLPERVCQQVIDAVQTGSLEAGERLPSERELSEQFGVSRVVIREALRSLRAMGWVEGRPGRGTYVSVTPGATAANAWKEWLTRHRDEVSELLVLRQAIEQLAARQAADSAVPSDIDALRGRSHDFTTEAAKPTPSLERLVELDLEFHRVVAVTGHGQLLPTIVDELAQILIESRRATFAFPDRPMVSAEDHRIIAAAIEAHDSGAAGQLMFDHIGKAIDALSAFSAPAVQLRVDKDIDGDGL